jgi:hypothetical protein
MTRGVKPRLVAVASLAVLLGWSAADAALVRASVPADDIRDIHGPIVLKTRRPTWWAVGSGTVVIAAAAGAAAWSRRGQRRLPPGLRALRVLARQRALAAGHPRAFAIAVSETVRAYLEEAFAIQAPRRTTEELLADLVRDRSGPLAAHQFELTEFLRQCDLAKFAGAALSAARMNAMLDSAEALVRATAVPPHSAAPLAGVA